MTDNLDADYAGAGFGGKLQPGHKAAFIIVDVVMAYLDPACHLYAGAGAESALASNERLVAAARASAVPVVFTNVAYVKGGADGGQFFRKVPALRAFEPGSPYGAFPATLRPVPGELVLTKQYPSAFFGTSLASTMHAAGVDTVFITGYSTSGCVRATALDALCHGFAPFVIRDGCGDRDARPHEQNLFDMQAKMAEVIGEDDAVALFAAFGDGATQ
jgi:maleamate amidohydrolase